MNKLGEVKGANPGEVDRSGEVPLGTRQWKNPSDPAAEVLMFPWLNVLQIRVFLICFFHVFLLPDDDDSEMISFIHIKNNRESMGTYNYI